MLAHTQMLENHLLGWMASTLSALLFSSPRARPPQAPFDFTIITALILLDPRAVKTCGYT